jgi:hypothetical protein
MADLKVAFDLLDSAEQTMTSLTSEFKNIKAQESDYDGAMGSREPWVRSPVTGTTTGTSWSGPCRPSAR